MLTAEYGLDFSGYCLYYFSKKTGRYELYVKANGSSEETVRIWHKDCEYINMPLTVNGKPIQNGRVYEARLSIVEDPAMPDTKPANERQPIFSASADRNTECTPNARVQGRSVLGTLPSPAYITQAEGTIVVEILVDQYGNVTKATAGAPGTTLNDAMLWAAARNAALKAHFNVSADAPARQQVTITYNFRLNQ